MNNAITSEPMFHCTPYWNFTPILRSGIDPKLSRGQLPVSWYVDHERVAWAILHVAERYECEVREVIIFEVLEKPKGMFFIAPQIGVYRSGALMRPGCVYPAYNWFPKEI